jgi:phosphate transport system substrate-binding protein
MSQTFKKLASVALVAAFVAPVGYANAAASSTLYGGGATLPAIGYIGESFFTTGSRQTNPADDGSLFGAWSAGYKKPTVSYCQTGSGFGKGVLDGANNATGNCGSFNPPVSPAGFSATTSDANFAGSDSPLSTTDYSTFITNKGSTHTEPVQVPAVAGAVAIIYNNGSVTGQLPLTDSQICDVFSGKINNWSQLGQAAQPITVIYRSDGSGTSFGFTNHLSKVCKLSTGHFSTNQTFASSPVGFSLPAGSVAASGNPGVVNAIDTTPGAIGYGEVADALARDPNLGVATVNGKDPVKDLKPTYSIKSSDVVTDQVIGPVDPNTGRATLQPISNVAVPGCVVLVNPDGYATSTTSYPIVAVSYLLGYYSGNGDDASNVKSLLKAPFTYGVKKKTTTIGTGTGFAFLSYGASSKAKKALGACINN